MAIPSVSQLPHHMGGHAVRLLWTTPSPCSAPHYASVQHGHRPANTITLHACSTSTRSRCVYPSSHRPFHGHPLLFMGVRGRTEVRNIKRLWSAYCFSSSKLRSAGCRGVRASARWVPFAAGVCKAAAGYRACGGACVLPSCWRYNSRSCRRRSGPSFASAFCITGSRILVSLANLGPYTPLARH